MLHGHQLTISFIYNTRWKYVHIFLINILPIIHGSSGIRHINFMRKSRQKIKKATDITHRNIILPKKKTFLQCKKEMTRCLTLRTVLTEITSGGVFTPNKSLRTEQTAHSVQHLYSYLTLSCMLFVVDVVADKEKKDAQCRGNEISRPSSTAI